MFTELTADGSEFNIKTLKLTGSDLMDLGVSQGREIGYWLKEMLDRVIEGKIQNDKKALLNEVNRLIEEKKRNEM